MENLKELIAIAGSFVGIIITVISFLIPYIKNSKAKQALEAANELAKQIQPLVVQAENYVNYTGAEKKQFVLTSVNDYAIKNGIKFNQNVISDKIEEIVETTKAVNARPKDLTKNKEEILP